MMTLRGKVLRRIQITKSWKVFLKQYAKSEEIQLGEIVKRAIAWWAQKREEERVVYLATHGKTEGWSMWLPVDLAQTVASISDEDVTNDSAVIYTALVLYGELVIKGHSPAQVFGMSDYTPTYHRPENLPQTTRFAKAR